MHAAMTSEKNTASYPMHRTDRRMLLDWPQCRYTYVAVEGKRGEEAKRAACTCSHSAVFILSVCQRHTCSHDPLGILHTPKAYLHSRHSDGGVETPYR